MELLKLSVVLFVIKAMYLFVAMIVANFVFMLTATIYQCLSETCTNVFNDYVFLVFSWESWGYIFEFYLKIIGLLYFFWLALLWNGKRINAENDDKD